MKREKIYVPLNYKTKTTRENPSIQKLLWLLSFIFTVSIRDGNGKKTIKSNKKLTQLHNFNYISLRFFLTQSEFHTIWIWIRCTIIIPTKNHHISHHIHIHNLRLIFFSSIVFIFLFFHFQTHKARIKPYGTRTREYTSRIETKNE